MPLFLSGACASPLATTATISRAKAILFASIDIIQLIGSANCHNADVDYAKRGSAVVRNAFRTSYFASHFLLS
jgi:hypothetical protein